MSHSLLKIIESSFVPILVTISAKLLGLAVISFFLNMPIEVRPNFSALLGFQTLTFSENIQTLSSYSDLFMFAATVAGFSYVLFSAVYLHDTHAHVTTINFLIKRDLLSLLRGSYQLYHEGAAWFVFTWVCNIVILFNVLLGRTYVWVFALAFCFTLFLSIILVRDFLQEVNLAKKYF